MFECCQSSKSDKSTDCVAIFSTVSSDSNSGSDYLTLAARRISPVFTVKLRVSIHLRLTITFALGGNWALRSAKLTGMRLGRLVRFLRGVPSLLYVMPTYSHHIEIQSNFFFFFFVGVYIYTVYGC
jgi:hypothetical protein